MYTEFAVLKLFKDGRCMTVYWGSPQQVKDEAKRLNEEDTEGHEYRAVQTTQSGMFESITDDTLYHSSGEIITE